MRICEKELTEQSDFYNRVMEEGHELLEKFPFISTLIDRDEIESPMELTMLEARALSKFLSLESDRRDM